MNQLDWETLVSAWIDAAQREDEARWAKAAVAKVVLEQFGPETARTFAAEVGASARLVHKSRQTFDAFPSSEAREEALSFEHHFLASCGEVPVDWIIKAAERRLSLRQLRDAIVRAEADRQTAPRGSYRFGKSDEFEAHDLGVALVGEHIERQILSKPQWLELLRLLVHFAAANRWLEAETLAQANQALASTAGRTRTGPTQGDLIE